MPQDIPKWAGHHVKSVVTPDASHTFESDDRSAIIRRLANLRSK